MLPIQVVQPNPIWHSTVPWFPYRYHASAAEIMHLKAPFFQRTWGRLTNAAARIDLIFAARRVRDQ
jgi:hypothetical protein